MLFGHDVSREADNHQAMPRSHFFFLSLPKNQRNHIKGKRVLSDQAQVEENVPQNRGSNKTLQVHPVKSSF